MEEDLKKASGKGRAKGSKAPPDPALEAGKKLAIPCQGEEWRRFYGLVALRLGREEE